jgi:hypothetical protein
LQPDLKIHLLVGPAREMPQQLGRFLQKSDKINKRCHKRMYDSVAQPVEHYTFNVGVLGSNPSGITNEAEKAFSINFGEAFSLHGRLENAKCARRKPGIFVFTPQRQKLRFCERRRKNKNNAR